MNSSNNNKILLIEICNYLDYPLGGHLAFAKQMLLAYGDQLALVGMSTDDTKVGTWTKKEIDGKIYDYFSVCREQISNKKPLIPARLKSFLAVKKYNKRILEKGINNVFIQTPEVLFALPKYLIKNLCVRIPGVENPLLVSRYWYSRYLSSIFDYFFFNNLKNANVILASANREAVDKFFIRSRNIIPRDKIIQFPTRINTDIFFPIPRNDARSQLNLSIQKKIIVTTGRLSALKGWKFMIDCFMRFRKIYSDSLFILMGDGEDHEKIVEYIRLRNLSDCILLAGRLGHSEVAKYLNASDIFIMGSYIEGWSTSLLEAIACAKPVVCTNFSSAYELIDNGSNGFVIEAHDEVLFTDAMVESLKIQEKNLLKKVFEIQCYSTSKLKENILSYWKLI